MVASSQSSSAKFPPLSYAERVKNAQNSKPVNHGPSQKPVAAPPVTSNLPATSTSTGSSSASANGGTTDSNHIPPITSPAIPISPFVRPTDNADGKTPNGDASLAKDEKPLPSTPQKPVNVWDLRKEQMAAARASATRLSQSKSLQLDQPSSPSSAMPPTSRSADVLSHKPANGSLPPPFAHDDDPFVVRVPVRPPAAPTEDVESWPEVGKSVVTNPTPHVTPDRMNGEPSEVGPPSSTTPRKSEKTKWVPIPAQELQAAADAAMKPQHRSHSRNLSRHSNTGPRHNNQGSASGSVYDQTRSHSGRNSTSQSRVQSRTGSVQSSPRLPRGRRLPNDEPPTFEYPPHTDSVLVRTSRAGSPQLSPQSSRQSQLFDSNGTVPPYSHGIYAPMPGNGANTYYPHPHPPPLPTSIPSPGPQNPPYLHHSPQNSIQYGPNGGGANYPNQSPQSLPPPVPGYPGVPSPYSMYPTHQFDYNQGPGQQPYMYWNGSGHNTPPYPPPMPHYNMPPPLPPQHYPLPISDAPSLLSTNMQPPVPEDPEGRGPDPSLVGQPVIFGSIGIPGASHAPSPAPQLTGSTNDDVTSINHSFTVFSIGVSPGERSRNRPRIIKAQNRTETNNEPTNCEQTERVGEKEKPVIDLTEPDRKWEFGTTGLLDSELPPPAPASPHVEATPVQQDTVLTTSVNGDFNASVTHSPLILENAVPPVVQMRPTLIPPPFVGPPMGSLSPLDVESSRAPTEWEVQDYRFGHAGGSGYTVPFNRDQMDVRERERTREREIERERTEGQREDTENLGSRDGEFSGRSRRGSYNGGYYERGFRRGRGYGRGRRGDRFHSSSRYSITPPQNFQSLGPFGDSSNGFYSQTPPHSAYVPAGYESYPSPLQSSGPQPPVPVPISVLSFPLDSTRYYLLGQLEYYLSPQNMAQDFFLRKQMDSKGWIPITLLASFNRVKRLAADVQLVRDVLVLSAIAEVKDDWVRMIGWEQFVLPDAVESMVEQDGPSTGIQHEHENNDDEDDEEEEDVVFVMGREAALWTPERRRP